MLTIDGLIDHLDGEAVRVQNQLDTLSDLTPEERAWRRGLIQGLRNAAWYAAQLAGRI